MLFYLVTIHSSIQLQKDEYVDSWNDSKIITAMKKMLKYDS